MGIRLAEIFASVEEKTRPKVGKFYEKTETENNRKHRINLKSEKFIDFQVFSPLRGANISAKRTHWEILSFAN